MKEFLQTAQISCLCSLKQTKTSDILGQTIGFLTSYCTFNEEGSGTAFPRSGYYGCTWVRKCRNSGSPELLTSSTLLPCFELPQLLTWITAIASYLPFFPYRLFSKLDQFAPLRIIGKVIGKVSHVVDLKDTVMENKERKKKIRITV